MLKAMVVMGTRPEAIKLAPVVQRLRGQRDVQVDVILTGQHRELIQDFLEFFDLRPAADLKVMTENQSVASTAAAVLKGMEALFERFQPNLVLVQGDTTTAFAAAASAFFRRIKVGHVEAGLRTNNRFSPFPEEANRRWIATAADLHFAPTESARKNLLREGVPEDSIFVTGNTGIDALLETARRLEKSGHQQAGCDRPYLLVTVHRRENHGERMTQICRALLRLLERFPQHSLVLPVHPNPNVRKVVHTVLNGNPRVHLMEPLDYFQFVAYMQDSAAILTDSGGVQEEAPVFGKPIFVLRDTTERPEGIEAGLAEMVGWREEAIFSRVCEVLEDPSRFGRTPRSPNPYGDGLAAARIANVLGEVFQVPGLKQEVPAFRPALAGAPAGAS